jgi:hypothetical protein
MRRLFLAVLLASGLGSRPAPAAGPSRDFMAELVARGFFRAIVDGEVPAALPLCGAEVNFDGTRARGAAIERQLRQMAQRARARHLQLVKVVVLPAEEAVRRFGPPPTRMKGVAAAGRTVALARFNVLGAVAVLARQDGLWRVIALTD